VRRRGDWSWRWRLGWRGKCLGVRLGFGVFCWGDGECRLVDRIRFRVVGVFLSGLSGAGLSRSMSSSSLLWGDHMATAASLSSITTSKIEIGGTVTTARINSCLLASYGQNLITASFSFPCSSVKLDHHGRLGNFNFLSKSTTTSAKYGRVGTSGEPPIERGICPSAESS